MAMTMKVYEVDRWGGVKKVLRETAEVTPLKVPELSHSYPACKCGQCPTGPV